MKNLDYRLRGRFPKVVVTMSEDNSKQYQRKFKMGFLKLSWKQPDTRLNQCGMRAALNEFP